MAEPRHIEWLLEGVDAWNSRRERGHFLPDLSDADLRAEFQKMRRRNHEERMLRPVELIEVNLTGGNLKNAILGDATLSRARLMDANLSGAYLYGANLSGCDLAYANLSGCDLAYANLTARNVAGVNFSGADLSGIDFTDVNLATANLDGANLTGVRSAELLLYPATDSPEKRPGLVDYGQTITIEPGKRFGKPCIRGMRITVGDVLECFASGMSEAEILNDFPELTRQDILACFAFAADQERRMVFISATTS